MWRISYPDQNLSYTCTQSIELPHNRTTSVRKPSVTTPIMVEFIKPRMSNKLSSFLK